MEESTWAHLCNVRRIAQETQTFTGGKVPANKHRAKNVTKTLVMRQDS